MNTTLRHALENRLLAMGDDELLLGHRDSEWCGHAPILEEDIAFANLALDEIGHASAWYGLLAESRGEDPDRYPDRLVYFREAQDFRNVRLVELPKGDWAFSTLRQFLFDAYERVNLEALAGSRYPPLAQAAGKIRLEELYHLRHSRAWTQRLALGTGESHARMQNALEQLWPHAAQLFLLDAEAELLVREAYVSPAERLWSAWFDEVVPFLRACELRLPDGPEARDRCLPESAGREKHTPDFSVLVAEIQSVARLDPEANW
jgi:ring-1,2-phenylacetyl-CoA epoxidase subunit PaaC